MKQFIALLLALTSFPLLAQNTVTLTSSVTSGNGSITTNLTWSTNPALTAGTPCVGSGHPMWNGNKAGSGSQTITIDQSGTLPLTLTCTFPGSSLIEFSWNPATTNTDASAYIQSQRNLTRIRYTFNATLPTNPLPACTATGITCVEMDDSGASRPTVRTVTGISQTGTLRAVATHVNALGVESSASNAATKVFAGAVPVTQGVSITVNPVPNGPTNFSGL